MASVCALLQCEFGSQWPTLLGAGYGNSTSFSTYLGQNLSISPGVCKVCNPGFNFWLTQVLIIKIPHLNGRCSIHFEPFDNTPSQVVLWQVIVHGFAEFNSDQHKSDTFWQMLHYQGLDILVFFVPPLIPVGHSCVCYERCEVCAVSAGVTCETSHVNNVVWLCDKGRHQICSTCRN